jgi:hypothetical protein
VPRHNGKRYFLITLSLSLIPLAYGCSVKKNAENSSQTSDTKNVDTASKGPAGQKDLASKSTQSKPANGNEIELPQIEAAKKAIRLDSMPDTLTICTVSGTPITIGDYKRQLLLRATQLQDALGSNPDLGSRLLEIAKQRGLTLTQEEKDKLLQNSKTTQKVAGEAFQKYLKERKMTGGDFNQQVLSVGLALKMGGKLIEDQLLNEIVDRELLCSAARADGFGKTAFNKYIEFKNSPNFDSLRKSMPLSPEQLRDQIVKDELVTLMRSKIQKQSKVTDTDIAKLYKENKDKLRHGERIRMSQIIVAAPTVDLAPLESVRTQLKKSKPKMTDKELDQAVKVEEQQLKQKANDLLKRALNGEDFSTLANDYTDDPAARAQKNGGDIGWQEKTALVKEIASSVWPLKVGKVYPEVISTPFGYHVVKVTGKEGAGVMTYTDVKEGLKNVLVQNNSQEVVMEWLKEKHRSAPILLSHEFQELTKGRSTTK